MEVEVLRGVPVGVGGSLGVSASGFDLSGVPLLCEMGPWEMALTLHELAGAGMWRSAIAASISASD